MRKRLIQAFLLLAGIVFSLAAHGEGNQKKINDLAINAFATEAASFPRDEYTSLEELTAHQGKAERISRLPDWKVEQEADYWIGFEYENRYLRYYYSSAKNTFFARERRFYTNDWEYKYNIRIGMTEEELLLILGEQNKKKHFEHQIEIWYYPEKGNVELGFFFTYQHVLEAISISFISE